MKDSSFYLKIKTGTIQTGGVYACVGFFLTGVLSTGFSVSAQPAFPVGADRHEGDRAILIKEKDRDYYFQIIQGVDLKFPKEIRLKGNEVDLSLVIRQLRRVEQSHYDNFWGLQRISRDLLSYHINKLCAKTTDPNRCLNKASDELDTAVDAINQRMEGRILYPAGYLPPSEQNVNDRIFQRASRALNSECADACSDNLLSRSLIRGSPGQYQELYGKLKDKSKQCQKNLLDKVASYLESRSFPKPCLKTENKNHPVCKNMLRSIKVIQQRVSNLTDLVYGSDSADDTEAKAPCVTCTLKTEEGSIPPLKELAKDLEDKSQCLELSPGEEKTVHPSRGTGTSYTVKRDPDGGYSITFPMKFSVDEDYDGPFPKEEAPDRYRERVQECLAKANKNMLGPKGEKLKIQIEKPSWKKKGAADDSEKESQCREKNKTGTQHIRIGSKDHRSNAGKYESDIDCPTITHEILHLTGLCDEYKEKVQGFYTDPKTGETVGNNFGEEKNEQLNPSNYDFKPAFDCRVTARNSIMSDHHERWDNVKNGKNKSLLTAAQFKGILYGGCSSKNGKFNECSRLAYQSSQTAKEDCQKVKNRCEQENGLGLDKQEQIAALQKDIEGLEQFKENVLKIRKNLQEEGRLGETQREEYDRQLKNTEEKIRLERELLSRSPSQKEKYKRRNILKNLLSFQEGLLMERKIDEEKGLLDQTAKEKYNGYLSNTEKSLRDSREQLKIVQSWPDP